VLYATRDLLAMHTVAGGHRMLALPRPVEIVHELFTNRPVARSTDAFSVTLEPASTDLSYTGDAARLAGLDQ
jgi:hypothetical protein